MHKVPAIGSAIPVAEDHMGVHHGPAVIHHADIASTLDGVRCGSQYRFSP
jgi:hypothetical protein